MSIGSPDRSTSTPISLQIARCMPKAWARRAISWPMLPKPSTPSVRPCSPRDFEYSFLFHRPARRSATLSGMRRSSARISPKASSATATEFLPGQFAT